MKKFILSMVTLIASLFLISCSNAKEINQKELEKTKNEITTENTDIKVRVKENIIPVGTENITLIIENISNKQYFYGVAFELEKEIYGEWYKVPFKEEMYFIQIAYMLEPQQINEEKINLSYFGKLDVGKYRIIKKIVSDEKEITIGAEFEII